MGDKEPKERGLRKRYIALIFISSRGCKELELIVAKLNQACTADVLNVFSLDGFVLLAVGIHQYCEARYGNGVVG